MQTKKSLGQHWLNDESSLQAMVRAASVSSGDFILEIGPGLGSLTEKLLTSGAQVHGVELDERLAGNLKQKFENQPFELTMQSILEFDLTKLPKKYKVVANIPYYLTSHLIRVLGESTNKPEICVILVQKEVAQRVCAEAGSISILAVGAQFYFECSLAEDVPAHLFEPPPKVDSKILILKKRSKPLLDVPEKDFFRLIKAGFSSKRKTLKNALSAGLSISKDVAEKLLQESNIPPQNRAQSLSLKQWGELYATVLREGIINKNE